jgi:hypothetical protein
MMAAKETQRTIMTAKLLPLQIEKPGEAEIIAPYKQLQTYYARINGQYKSFCKHGYLQTQWIVAIMLLS